MNSKETIFIARYLEVIKFRSCKNEVLIIWSHNL